MYSWKLEVQWEAGGAVGRVKVVVQALLECEHSRSGQSGCRSHGQRLPIQQHGRHKEE